jgi:hypothetical protein
MACETSYENIRILQQFKINERHLLGKLNVKFI